jgi:hypothetical protein
VRCNGYEIWQGDLVEWASPEGVDVVLTGPSSGA